MRAAKYLVLPDEDAAEFAALEAALIEELASGALQAVLARRVVIAAWRLARADRLAAGTGLGPVAGRKGVGAPFPSSPATPNLAANRRTCSRSGATAPTPIPGSP
jgi:hypothetical protein